MARILVIENDLDLRDLLTLLLQWCGFEVQNTFSRDEVFAKLISFKPDVILLDVFMEKENGRDICKEIKEQYKEIAVILLSANPKLLLDHDECGADDTIEKPFNNRDVVDKIKRMLKKTAVI